MSSDERGMYGDRARYYDLIYHWKKYDEECVRLRELLGAQGIADGARIVEAACGTGSHLVHLSKWYQVAGFDISPAMLKIACSKLTSIDLFQADMASFSVERPFDALLCLFSSIGYVFPERLRAAAECFAAAIKPGGLIVIEPWLTPQVFTAGNRSMQTFQNETLSLCRMSIGRREGDLSIIDFHWLAAEQSRREVEHFIERHELWLYPTETLLKVFGEAGFDCRFEPNGLMKDRGLVVGKRG